jgi:hypothetical protein
VAVVKKRPTTKKRERPTDRAKAFVQALVEIGGGKFERWRLFADFCTLAAMTFANGIVMDDKREQLYMDTVKRYTSAEAMGFAECISIVTHALEEEPLTDFLGARFQEMELASHWHGQFFTPPELCRLMAALTIDVDVVKEAIATRGYVNMHEPAVGAGAMVLEAAQVVKANGGNPSRHMFVTAIDVDATAAYMAFIQLSLCGIGAAVHVGNTLSLEIRQTLLTPVYYLSGWRARLNASCGPRPEVVEAVEAAKVMEQKLKQAKLW